MRCANCGRPIYLVKPTERSSFKTPFWTHRERSGGNTDCRLSAEPTRATLSLSGDELEALLTILDGADDPTGVSIYDKARAAYDPRMRAVQRAMRP